MFSLFFFRYLLTCPAAAGILTPSSPPAASTAPRPEVLPPSEVAGVPCLSEPRVGFAVVEELFAGLEEVQEGWQPLQNIVIERCQQAFALKSSSLGNNRKRKKKNKKIICYRFCFFLSINNKQSFLNIRQPGEENSFQRWPKGGRWRQTLRGWVDLS